MGNIVTGIQAGVFGGSNPGEIRDHPNQFWGHPTSSTMRAMFLSDSGLHKPRYELDHSFI